ncbi:MAG TPA: hypothetical protein VGG96_07160 [Steroidobacteraceae bacterium]|jgi:hypothetical protein
MRPSLPLLVMTAWIVAPLAWSQTAVPQPAATQPSATQPSAGDLNAGDPNAGQHSAPAATAAGKASAAPASRRPHARHARSLSEAGAEAGAPAGKSAGVLALGATDITGNKELPKVMVIVPWKDSMGAGGVIKPTDSLLDEVLEPVDRGVFQRRIRYYGELNAAEKAPAAGKVAPVGDNK